jgi:glucosamine--fructose-6-phosphate aminotransferase (isomerizing)
LMGMGSSRYASNTAARYLQRAGLLAFADYASAEFGVPPGSDVAVLAVSAGGGSVETLQGVASHIGKSRVIAVTNQLNTELTRLSDEVVDVRAGIEFGGVACRSYSHTLAILLQLASEWGDEDLYMPTRLAMAADAIEDLFARESEWLPVVSEALAGPDGTWIMAPADRLASAEQSALMLREGPRRPADACETGDWSHVDVYLTKTLDYRALLLCGSRWDEPAFDWLRQRNSTWVAVGADVDGSAAVVRYAGDNDPLVALLTETLIAELVAHRWWTLTRAE